MSRGPSLTRSRVDAPIEAVVVRPSEDGRRQKRSTVELEAPSPVKRARAEAEARIAPIPAPDFRAVDTNDRYEMGRLPDEDGDAPMDAFDMELPAPGKRSRQVKPADPVLARFMLLLRDAYLREFLRREGRGDAKLDICARCGIDGPGREVLYRCRQCFGRQMHCRHCCVEMHAENPLHFVEASTRWRGDCFEKVLLKDLGLRVQLGHAPHERCFNPAPGHQTFVVLHTNGIHQVAVDFCACEDSSDNGRPDIQLLRRDWFPGSDQRPQTCATFEVLDLYMMQTLHAKSTMYDFYGALEKLTDNTGARPPNRYQVGGGRGHDPAGVMGTKPGELAIECPACPRPGINLPEGWEEASEEDKKLYILFLALDACFRLKRQMVSSELRDPGLGTGWAYMVEDGPYRAFLRTATKQKEMSTCSGLAALDHANTKFSRGYSSTGVGMGVCARHEFVQPNGVGDLQLGERYVNMDYIFTSILRHKHEALLKIISYDIVCQWWKHLLERLKKLPPLVRITIAQILIKFVIPKMHIHAHTLACQLVFSLNLLLGAAQTEGEGIERPWAHIGPIAASTRVMGPGGRHDCLDCHWSFWNWMKLIGIVILLRRRFEKAKVERAAQEEGLAAFSAEQAEKIPEWRAKVDDFEADPSKPNPYEIKVVGLNEAQVRLQFNEEEAKQAKEGVVPLHDVSPSTFMAAGLDLEEQQRRIRVQAELKKAGTTGQLIDLGTMRASLNRGLVRFRKLQATYMPAAVQAANRRAAPANELPEDTPLYLPSGLSDAERKAPGCMVGLDVMEMMYREAQCRTALEQLRTQLHVKSRLLIYKGNHARNQGATTKLRSLVARNESKIRLHSEKYQAAWEAQKWLAGGDESKVGWQRLRKADIRCMEDAEELTKRAARKQKQAERRVEREHRWRLNGELPPRSTDVPDDPEVDDELEEGEGGTNGTGAENMRSVSWIWMGAGTTGKDGDMEQVLRIEWSKAYARTRRWREEERLVAEEYRRVLVSFEHQARVWEDRIKGVEWGSSREEVLFAEGAVAYGIRQASLYRLLAVRGEVTWTEPKLGKGKKRAAVITRLPGLVELLERDDSEEEEEEEEEENANDLSDDEGMGGGGVGREESEGGEGEEWGGIPSDEEFEESGGLEDYDELGCPPPAVLYSARASPSSPSCTHADVARNRCSSPRAARRRTHRPAPSRASPVYLSSLGCTHMRRCVAQPPLLDPARPLSYAGTRATTPPARTLLTRLPTHARAAPPPPSHRALPRHAPHIVPPPVPPLPAPLPERTPYLCALPPTFLAPAVRGRVVAGWCRRRRPGAHTTSVLLKVAS
ncbi:hypothetical protein B0H11DRAFT_2249680 [Mycena galericulata]|nr:hypothetical protein B0H11DRAFT_2249680 [Mycena galericulata]